MIKIGLACLAVNSRTVTKIVGIFVTFSCFPLPSTTIRTENNSTRSPNKNPDFCLASVFPIQEKNNIAQNKTYNKMLHTIELGVWQELVLAN
jgi:hypothetical protein